MSDSGKLFRGKGYYNMRDREGNYPKGVTSNPNKMSDLNIFLETLPKEEDTPVIKEKRKK